MELTKEQIERNQEKLTKGLTPERLDLENPGKPQVPLQADEILRQDDEDENTDAKSIVDEIIEETEAVPGH